MRNFQIATPYRSPHNLVSSQVDHNLGPSSMPQTTYPRMASLHRLTCGVLCRCPEEKKPSEKTHLWEKKFICRDFSPKRTRRGKKKKKKRERGCPPSEPLSIKRGQRELATTPIEEIVHAREALSYIEATPSCHHPVPHKFAFKKRSRKRDLTGTRSGFCSNGTISAC